MLFGKSKRTIADVERALRGPLPGWQAQQRMATRPRVLSEDAIRRRPPREGAVLVLLYPYQAELHLILTLRSDRLANHRGQISFPGGAREEKDISLWDTALREAQEELALDPAQVRYIGALTPLYIPSSNFNVHPFVGYMPSRPHLVPNTAEVAQIIELPLDLLLDPRAKHEESWSWEGRQLQVPFYRYGEHIIWGATAMMLSELEVLLTRQGREPASSVADEEIGS